MPDLKIKYEELIKRYTGLMKEDEKASHIMGNGKLFLFILAIGFGIACVAVVPRPLFIISGVASTVGFIYLWVRHDMLLSRIKRCKAMIVINEKYIARVTGDWTKFVDTGQEFVMLEHPYGSDLDIVGEKSIFQLLNIAGTWHGRQAFAEDLLNADYPAGEISERQESILELSRDITFSQEFQYTAMEIEINGGVLSLMETLGDDSPFLRSELVKGFLKYTPLAAAPFISAVFIFRIDSLYITAAMILCMQFITWGLGIIRIKKYFGSICNMKYRLDDYGKLLRLLQDADFQSNRLRALQEKLVISGSSAAKAVKELDKILQKIDMRYNPLVYMFLNIFLLWDYECAMQLETWKKKYGMASQEWFPAIGELESLLSFSNLPNICGNTCTPVLDEENMIIHAINLGHPLLPEDRRVCNNFSTEGDVWIISGSNMSGKTTFLRTVGVNLALARAGSLVCAEKMRCGIFSLVTSMRIADDLNQGVSTFYAELRRIKMILDEAERDKHVMFFIDEIFRGTNSADRTLGARAVIERLKALGASGMLTTHDLSLCESVEGVKNAGFMEYFTDGRICFDYLLRPGISRTANAQYLMELLGIMKP